MHLVLLYYSFSIPSSSEANYDFTKTQELSNLFSRLEIALFERFKLLYSLLISILVPNRQFMD